MGHKQHATSLKTKAPTQGIRRSRIFLFINDHDLISKMWSNSFSITPQKNINQISKNYQIISRSRLHKYIYIICYIILYIIYIYIYTLTGFLLFLIYILCPVHMEKMVDGITGSFFLYFFAVHAYSRPGNSNFLGTFISMVYICVWSGKWSKISITITQQKDSISFFI